MIQYSLQFMVMRLIRAVLDHTTRRIDDHPIVVPTYIPTTSPVSGITGQPTSYGPSAQYVIASTPVKQEDTTPFHGYPSFAQTAQTVDSAWPGYISPPKTKMTSALNGDQFIQ
jgi:hypothetical protein